jgi:hypothetical protein
MATQGFSGHIVPLRKAHRGNTTAAARPRATLYAPKINGRDAGLLGYADLLASLDKKVYVTCGADLIVPPAEAQLYWGVDGSNQPRVIDRVPIVAETDTVTFVVPGAVIAGAQNPIDGSYAGDGDHDVFVRIDYGASHDDSRHTTALVKCSEPGGPDPVGATRDINENLPAPVVTPSTIPDASTPVTITINSYDVRYVGDRITFEWGGPRNTFTYDVDAASGVITVSVPPELIARAGGGKIPVSYYIYDKVGNWSKYAPYATPDVEIDPGTLTGPQLYYLAGTVVPAKLDLAVVGSDDVILRVPVRNLEVGDVVHAFWHAEKADGSEANYESGDLVFNDEDSQFYLDTRIDNTLAREAAGGTVRIWYVVQGSRAVSKRHLYAVSELPEFSLPAPRVPLAVGNTLDPFDQGTSIEVLVPFTEAYMGIGAHVTCTVVGRAGTSNRYWSDEISLSSGDLGQPIPFYCPATELQAVVNGTADFSYEVAQASVDEGSRRARALPVGSDILTLNIRHAGALPDYPAPTVLEVVNDVLDPELSQAHARVPLPAEGGPVVGTDVTLHWAGKVPYYSTGKVPGSGPLEFRVTRPYIEGNRDSDVTVTYEDAARRASKGTTFHVGKAQADLPPPTVKETGGTDTLLPAAAQNGATVRVPATLSPGDRVVVHFGEYSSPAVNWSANLDVVVPPGEVAKTLGKTIDVSYTVNGERASAVFRLHVLDFSDNDANLPAPSITEASGGELDLSTFSGPAHATLASWPLMAEDQHVWIDITWSGGTISVLSAHRVTTDEVGRRISANVPRAQLDRLPDGTSFTLVARVTLNGSANKTDARVFPARAFTLRKSAPLYIDPSRVSLNVGDAYQREATGGQPPYAYKSLAASIVRITGQGSGSILAVSRGDSTIVATDEAANSVSYPVTVSELHPPMDFGAAVSLNCTGYIVAEGRPPLNPPSSATYTRTATGGEPPYTYSSSNPLVATIDAFGRVRVGANGITTMIARDRAGTTATHQLTTYGAQVWRHRTSWGFITHAEQTGVYEREGDLVRCPNNRAEIAALRAVYLPESNNPAALLGWLQNYMWTNEFSDVNNFYWVKAMSDGAEDRSRYTQIQALVALVR